MTNHDAIERSVDQGYADYFSAYGNEGVDAAELKSMNDDVSSSAILARLENVEFDGLKHTHGKMEGMATPSNASEAQVAIIGAHRALAKKLVKDNAILI